MSKVQIFTSTGGKLVHHPEVIADIKYRHRVKPISLQVAPTSRCNLNCVFCSNASRGNKQEDIDFGLLKDTIFKMRNNYLKTIEWTGGGDPTQWAYINEAIKYAADLGLKQGFITNGVALKDVISKKSLDCLTWLRVSLNSLDYVNSIELPKIKGTLGFSYVINGKTDPGIFEKIREDYINKYHPSYVRVVPNCQSTYKQQEINNRFYSKEVRKLGPPFFYQKKSFKTPVNCWWCYIKPFILHDGYVYPCSSIVLNRSAERSFHKTFRWCQMIDLPGKYSRGMKPFTTDFCTHCVFTSQNELVGKLLTDNFMDDFV